MQGARVGCVLVNWMCSPKDREHPRDAPRGLLTQADVAHVYGTAGDLPLQKLGFCFLGIKSNFFCQAIGHVGSYNPDQGSNLQPPRWKLRVLTIG